jgi:hypothetical protein
VLARGAVVDHVNEGLLMRDGLEGRDGLGQQGGGRLWGREVEALAHLDGGVHAGGEASGGGVADLVDAVFGEHVEERGVGGSVLRRPAKDGQGLAREGRRTLAMAPDHREDYVGSDLLVEDELGAVLTELRPVVLEEGVDLLGGHPLAREIYCAAGVAHGDPGVSLRLGPLGHRLLGGRPHGGRRRTRWPGLLELLAGVAHQVEEALRLRGRRG